MKSLFAKLPVRTSLGVYYTEDEIAVSRVSCTPFGPIETFRACEPSDASLEDILAPMVRRHSLIFRPSTVTAALPTKTIFHSTRPLHGGVVSLQPQQILRESLNVSQARAGGMMVDVVRARRADRDIVGVAACDQSYFAGLQQRFIRAGFDLAVAEPAPCSLMRVVAALGQQRRRNDLILNVFLGEQEGLGVLISGLTPLIWRTFALPRGDEAAALLSIARSLEPLAKYCGVDAPLEVVAVHGRPDLHPLLSRDWLEDKTGAAIWWFDRPGFEPAEIAFGAALCGAADTSQSFNLARATRPKPLLRQYMPWGQLAVQVSLVVGMAAFHVSQMVDLQQAVSLRQKQNTFHREFGNVSDAQLQAEKGELETKLNGVHRYLETRVEWHSILRDLGHRLPPNVALTAWQGINELEQTGQRAAKPKKHLVLRGAALMSDEGNTPHELENFVQGVSQAAELKRHFPETELGNLQQSVDANDRPVVNFTITCRPRDTRQKQQAVQP